MTNHFLTKIEKCFALSGIWDDSDKVKVFPTILEGKAEEWAWGIKAYDSWEELKAKLVKHFHPDYKIEREWEKWKKI